MLELSKTDFSGWKWKVRLRWVCQDDATVLIDNEEEASSINTIKEDRQENLLNMRNLSKMSD